MILKYAKLFLVPALLSACRAASVPNNEPGPVTETPAEITAPSRNSRDSWMISPIQEEHSYRSVSNTSLELTTPTGITKDSLVSTVGFSLSVLRAPDRVSYTATVQSMSAQGGLKTGFSSSSRLPFSFGGHLEQGRLITDPSVGQQAAFNDCSNEALAAVPVVQRSVIVVPFNLRKDMSWTDSTTTAACTGSIPTTSVTVRRYKVIGETHAGGIRGILLERLERTTSEGEGSQGQHRVKLRVDGSATAQIAIDVQTGAFLESTAVQTAAVVITSSGRDQHFTQITHERITRLD